MRLSSSESSECYSAFLVMLNPTAIYIYVCEYMTARFESCSKFARCRSGRARRSLKAGHVSCLYTCDVKSTCGLRARWPRLFYWCVVSSDTLSDVELFLDCCHGLPAVRLGLIYTLATSFDFLRIFTSNHRFFTVCRQFKTHYILIRLLARAVFICAASMPT